MLTAQLWVTQVEIFREMRSFHLRFSIPRDRKIPSTVSTKLNQPALFFYHNKNPFTYFLRI